MTERSRRWFEGRRILGVTALGLALTVALTVVAAPSESASALWLTIITARLSLALFLVTFCASAINGLWKGRGGKWLLRNRRFLGLSFATSHVVHAFAFSWFASTRGQSLPELVGLPTVIGGSVGYLTLLVLAVTSTDAAVRRLGRDRWVVLHRTGMYIFFAIFVFSYVRRSLRGDVLSVLSMAMLLAALGLRIANRLRMRSRTRRSGP